LPFCYASVTRAGNVFGGASVDEREAREHVSERIPLPRHYFIDESDPDIVVLRRQDGTFVAAFSSSGATREGIVDAAREDYQRLLSEGVLPEEPETD
jgi:hypothetical protein